VIKHSNNVLCVSVSVFKPHVQCYAMNKGPSPPGKGPGHFQINPSNRPEGPGTAAIAELSSEARNLKNMAKKYRKSSPQSETHTGNLRSMIKALLKQPTENDDPKLQPLKDTAYRELANTSYLLLEPKGNSVAAVRADARRWLEALVVRIEGL
jgi:hypothetical protein